MGYCFVNVASEIVRRKVVAGGNTSQLLIDLVMPVQRVSRARAEAKFCVRLFVPGAPEPWQSGVDLVDVRGYLVEWAFSDVGKWLVKSLSGSPCVVSVRLQDAASMPTPWTPARVEALAGKVAVMSPASVRAVADDKTQSVAAWAESDRKTSVIMAAQKMRDAADVLQQLLDMQAGAEWGGPVPAAFGASKEQAVTVGYGGSVSAQLTAASNEAWWRIDTDAAGATVVLSGNLPNCRFAILDDAGNELAAQIGVTGSWDMGSSANPLFVRLQGNGDTGPFLLSVSH